MPNEWSLWHEDQSSSWAQPNAHTQVAAVGGSWDVRRGKRKWTLTTTIACYLQCEIPVLQQQSQSLGVDCPSERDPASGDAGLVIIIMSEAGQHHYCHPRLDSELIIAMIIGWRTTSSAAAVAVAAEAEAEARVGAAARIGAKRTLTWDSKKLFASLTDSPSDWKSVNERVS